MRAGASPAPATLSLAVISSSSLSVCWSSPQRGEGSCLVLKPLTVGQTWCWSSSLGRWFSQPQGRRGCPSPEWDPVGRCPPCPPTPSMCSQERRGDGGRVTQEEHARYRPEHTHWDLSAWAWEASPVWEHLSDSWGKGHIPARYEGKLERCWRGQLQLNTARKEGKTTMLSERKEKGAFSKPASLNLSWKSHALYL